MNLVCQYARARSADAHGKLTAQTPVCNPAHAVGAEQSSHSCLLQFVAAGKALQALSAEVLFCRMRGGKIFKRRCRRNRAVCHGGYDLPERRFTHIARGVYAVNGGAHKRIRLDIAAVG